MTHGSALISIVIPTWNRPAFVERLVGAINAAESRSDLEIVVVDNDSEEGNWAQLQKIAASYGNIRLYKNAKNIGMTPNWNKAIEYARGEWIGFMCDDDIYKPDSIGRIRKLISAVSKPCLILQNSSIGADSVWIEPGVGAANSGSPPSRFWTVLAQRNYGETRPVRRTN